MKHTDQIVQQIEQSENEFYKEFLVKALDYAKNPKQYAVNGIFFKTIVAAAGVVAKQKQTRGAMAALEYQIKRDTARGYLDPRKELPEKTKS